MIRASCLALLLIGCQEPEPPSPTGRVRISSRGLNTLKAGVSTQPLPRTSKRPRRCPTRPKSTTIWPMPIF